MKQWIVAAVALAAAFFGGWWLGQRAARPEVVERVQVDTVFYERPKPISTSDITVSVNVPPISTSDITVSVNVPKLVFAKDTVMLHAFSGNVASNVASFTNQGSIQVTTQIAETVTNCNGLEPSIKNYLNTDSVQIAVMERTLEYRDSTYYARVVGPVVGPLGPRLDFIETYNKTVERVQLVREPYAWELGPAMGAWMSGDGSGVWAGAYARRTFGRFSVSASAGYDPRKKSVIGQVEARMAIWRR